MTILDAPTRIIIPATWLAWAALWIVAAFYTKATRWRESIGSRARHVVPFLICFVLLAALNRYLCHPPDGLARCGTDGSDFDCPVFSPDLLDAQAPAGSPDRVLDDLGREPMAAITGQGHADILPYSATDPVSVTMPAATVAAAQGRADA